MAKQSKPKITIISLEEWEDDEFHKSGSFYVRNALGEIVLFHCRKREEAQRTCDELYSIGQYKVNACRMTKAPESQSAVGRINSRSRAGSRKV